MKRKLLYMAVISIFFLSSTQPKKVDIESMQFDELFTYFILCNDSNKIDLISQALYDSILINPRSFFYPIEKVDSNSNDVSFNFGISNFDYDDFSIKERNIYYILINRKDSIEAERKYISNIDSLIPDFKLHLTNPYNLPYLPQKRTEIINIQDTVEICKYAFWIDGQTVSDSTGNKTSWSIIKKAVNHASETIYLLRNELSQKVWNKNYSELKLNQKVEVSECFPITIWVYPDVEIYILPPTPLPFNETKKILDLDKELTRLILEESRKK